MIVHMVVSDGSLFQENLVVPRKADAVETRVYHESYSRSIVEQVGFSARVTGSV